MGERMNINIDCNKCINCKACILLCPSGALSQSKNGDWVQINFNSCKCEVSCNKCYESCPTKAIKLNYHKNMNNFLLKFDNCEICGKKISKCVDNKYKNLCTKCKKLKNARSIYNVIK